MILWTPAEITTTLWLDAADETTIILDASDNVERWYDKSGNDNHAEQSGTENLPSYDQESNAVIFSGSEIFELPNSLASLGNIEAFVVGQYTQNQSDTAYMLTGFTSGLDHRFYVAGCAPGPNTIYFAVGISTALDNSLDRNNNIHIWSMSHESSTAKAYDDGSLVTSATRNYSGTPTVWCLGGVNGTPRTIGKIYEVVLFDTVLPTEDRQRIEGYLAHKWGLEANLAGDHPYKDNPPETEGNEEVEDISLDLSAYYQARDNLAAILAATDGTAFQDLEAILKVYGQSIDDLPAELAAYYHDRQDIAAVLKTLATGYKDLPTALQAMGLGRDDLPAQLKALAWAGKDLSTVLAAVTPLVFRDLGLSLSATDGTTINDLSTVLAAVKRAPQYRSVVAQRVRSVISEVS